MGRSLLFLWIIYLSVNPIQIQAQLTGDSWEQVRNNKKGTITMVHLEAPAISHTGSSGYVEGICIDIVQEFVNFLQIKKGVKLKVELKQISNEFAVFMETVKNAQKGVWGIGNITITEERKKSYHFSQAFIKNFSVLISHYSATTLPSLKVMNTYFQDMKAYTVKGTTNEKIILSWKKKYFPAMPIVYVRSSGEVLKRVSQDPKSFTTLDFNYFASAFRAGYNIRRHATGDSSLEEFGIIMPKDSDWKNVWDEFLNTFKQSNKYFQILSQHLGYEASEVLKNIKK